jgi:hypothetical protein
MEESVSADAVSRTQHRGRLLAIIGLLLVVGFLLAVTATG